MDDTVFVGIDNNLCALNADTGEQQWGFYTDFRHGQTVFSSPTVVDDTAFVGGQNGNVYALDADVSGSSEGSRIRLGTLGHHHGEDELSAGGISSAVNQFNDRYGQWD